MEKNTRDDIKYGVYRIIADIMKLPDNWYTFKSNDSEDVMLFRELNADSLDALHIVMEIEYELPIVLKDSLFTSDVTLGQIIDYICRKLNISS